jgi:hypothetical protein
MALPRWAARLVRATRPLTTDTEPVAMQWALNVAGAIPTMAAAVAIGTSAGRRWLIVVGGASLEVDMLTRSIIPANTKSVKGFLLIPYILWFRLREKPSGHRG